MHRERTSRTSCLYIILGVFLIGCLSITVLAAASEQDGSIRIYSTPPGSGACLDSTDNSGNCIAFDSTGFAEFFNIASDSSHTVSVFLDGYQTYTTTVSVSPGQEVVLHAMLQPNPSATTAAIRTPPAPATPDLLQSLITIIRNLFSGGGSGTPGSQSRSGSALTPVTGSGNGVIVTPTGLTEGTTSPHGKVIAAYFLVLDDAYPAVMSVKDEIPWKKVNRVYIAFATIHDGVLTDYSPASSPEDGATREENGKKIQNVVALVRQNNPDAEIFISSNFGEEEMDNEYLRAAQDPQKFADSVVNYLKTYGLDGYDMDWESRKIDDYAPQLTSLLSACHDRFAAEGNSPRGHPYRLTHTVWPGVESPDTVAGLADSVDQLNLMTYGPGDTYDLTSYATAYHDAGFPFEKMIGGVESESGYGESGGHDTQASITAKCAYVKENNLAGLFEWRMDNDIRPNNGPPTYQVTGWMYDCLASE